MGVGCFLKNRVLSRSWMSIKPVLTIRNGEALLHNIPEFITKVNIPCKQCIQKSTEYIIKPVECIYHLVGRYKLYYI